MALPYALFKQRREQLRYYAFQDDFFSGKGVIIVGGAFEDSRSLFRQDSSLYYLTGIEEPGAILCIYSDGLDVLYVPRYGANRAQWVTTAIDDNKAFASVAGLNEIKYLGVECRGYTISPLFIKKEYELFLNDISSFLLSGDASISMILDDKSPRSSLQQSYLSFLSSFFPSFNQRFKDCAEIVHAMRRIKDKYELDCIHRAVQITEHAHKAAMQMIEVGKGEQEIQAIIESIFTMLGARRPAFPSIVATGKNSTVLHYTDRNQTLKDGDLVVVDIGAEYEYYAADVTRTYPASGAFSPRQKELYMQVLETQMFVESIAAPGMFINNPACPEKSLHHNAVNFLKKKGYDSYFSHGIGHFLGLDVHDVGDPRVELEPGDVITIEPGIYLPKENNGIRIEDDYVIVDGGCVCLTQHLPKTINEIEVMLQQAQ